MIDVMLGLWNDGSASRSTSTTTATSGCWSRPSSEFCKRYQLPGIYRVMDWHRAVREFFRTKEKAASTTPFIHADESETSLSLYLYPEMVDMARAVDTEGVQFLPGGHFDTSVDMYQRPHRWKRR